MAKQKAAYLKLCTEADEALEKRQGVDVCKWTINEIRAVLKPLKEESNKDDKKKAELVELYKKWISTHVRKQI